MKISIKIPLADKDGFITLGPGRKVHKDLWIAKIKEFIHKSKGKINSPELTSENFPTEGDGFVVKKELTAEWEKADGFFYWGTRPVFDTNKELRAEPSLLTSFRSSRNLDQSGIDPLEVQEFLKSLETKEELQDFFKKVEKDLMCNINSCPSFPNAVIPSVYSQPIHTESEVVPNADLAAKWEEADGDFHWIGPLFGLTGPLEYKSNPRFNPTMEISFTERTFSAEKMLLEMASLSNQTNEDFVGVLEDWNEPKLSEKLTEALSPQEIERVKKTLAHLKAVISNALDNDKPFEDFGDVDSLVKTLNENILIPIRRRKRYNWVEEPIKSITERYAKGVFITKDREPITNLSLDDIEFIDEKLPAAEIQRICETVTEDELLNLIRIDRPWTKFYSVISFELNKKFNKIDVKCVLDVRKEYKLDKPPVFERSVELISYPLANLRPLSEKEIENRRNYFKAK